MTHRQAVWLMVLVTLMWSIAGVVTRQVQGLGGFEVTFWRSLFTALSLLVILPLWPGRAPLAWRRPALWLSGLCWAVMFTAFMLALTLTSVANTLVTMALGPFFTALLARLWIGHRVAARTWAAMLVAGAGLALMHAAQLGTDASALTGSLVALAVPLAGAVNWTLVQRSQARQQQVDLVPAVLIGALLSALLTLPLAWPLAGHGADIGWLALLGLVQLAIPCSLAVLCARVLKAPEVSLLALLEVVFGIAWVWWLVGEQPTAAVLLGGGLVLAALLLNEWLGLRAARA